MVKGIPVAYEALPNTADYDAVRADVERQLPLRNLHWVRKSSANRTIRTIQALHLDVRPLTSFGDAPSKPDLLERPYLYLLFVVCEDSEVYRATLRSQIREWLDGITSKQHQEWLIVHVSSGKGGVAKFYQRKGAIVDKIKADFNVGKKDRCIQVVQGASADDPTAWAEFITKVKEGIVATFDSNVALYEENVRKADSQRQLEGWQFLPFFRQKEALATSFQATTLFEDALIQYDELEASFFQNQKDHRNAAWYRDLGGTSKGDDSLALLSTTNKAYAKMIESNSISVFDFRTYLFARQAEMLFQLGRVVEVARRGAYFISTFARTLREHQASLGPNFVESWTYSACLNIVEECERRISQDLRSAGGTSFIAVKAELLELARKQLDKIGMSAGHLPTTHPFSMSLNETSPSSTPASSSSAPTNPSPVTREDLIAAIADQAAFDKLYVGLAHRAVSAYQQSGRKRCALKLHAFLAALEHHRQQFDAAQKLYSQLPVHYTDTRWTLLESYLLSRCTRLQQQLDLPKDRLLSTLALVRSGMTFGSRRWSLEAVVEDGEGGGGEEGERRLAEELMKAVYELSSTLAKDFAAVAFPTFSIRLQPGSGKRGEEESGIKATVLVHNALPCSLRVDEVRLKLATSVGEQIWLTAGACELQPAGETAVTVSCPTTVTGLLLLELSQLRFSRIIFQYSHRPVSPHNLAPDPRNVPTTTGGQPSLFFPQDHEALHVFTDDPMTVHLDRDREIVIGVDPGRNSITRLALRFSPSRQDVFFATGATHLDEGGARFSSDSDDHLVLESLTPHKIVKLRIPIAGTVVDPVIHFTLNAEYSTTRRPQTRRQLRWTFAYSIALSLAVNVQDYFRESCLLSKFSVTTDGVQGLWAQSARIEAPSAVTVKPCRSAGAPPVLISPLQTANFLFKLFCDAPASVQEPLRLILSYSSIEDRLRSHASALSSLALSAAHLTPHRRWIRSAFLSHVVASTLLDRYSETQSLAHVAEAFDEEAWRRRARRCAVREEEVEGLVEAVRVLYGSARAPIPAEASSHWRQLEIPLDLPSLHILSLVRLTPAITRVEVGQAVPVTLSIRSSFRWRRQPQLSSAQAGGEGKEEIRLQYEVVANAQEWIVSGQAKGEFAAQETDDLTLPLLLIPLVPSTLFLPSIAIQPSSSSSHKEYLTCETQHVTAAVGVEVLPIRHRTTWEVEVAAAA
ncbi:hypothetical protein JCM8097_005646 [Rhodosporidiobolus ruineniae]